MSSSVASAVRFVRLPPTALQALATIAGFGFTHVGEQWDDEDGTELLYERPAR